MINFFGRLDRRRRKEGARAKAGQNKRVEVRDWRTLTRRCGCAWTLNRAVCPQVKLLPSVLKVMGNMRNQL